MREVHGRVSANGCIVAPPFFYRVFYSDAFKIRNFEYENVAENVEK